MNNLRRRLHVIVFGTITKAGRRFDVVLQWVILLSVLVVKLESVPALLKLTPQKMDPYTKPSA